jgi:GNAT superfamily N-acetyltransferase
MLSYVPSYASLLLRRAPRHSLLIVVAFLSFIARKMAVRAAMAAAASSIRVASSTSITATTSATTMASSTSQQRQSDKRPKSPVTLLIRSVNLFPHGMTLTPSNDGKVEIWPQGSDVAIAHHLGITAYPPSLHEGPEVTAALSRAFPSGSLLAFDVTPTATATIGDVAGNDKPYPLAGYIFCFPAKRGQVHALNDSNQSAKVAEHLPTSSSSPSSSRSDMSMYLHDIAVYPSYEGRGVAAALLSHFDSLSRSLSLPYQSLTAVHWRGADVFWKSRGFIPLRTFEYAPGMPATYMERPTPSPSTTSSTLSPTTVATNSAL